MLENPHHVAPDADKVSVGVVSTDRFNWKKLWSFMGPGFLISIAYIDPGNLDTDIHAGATFQYQLLWVLAWATVMGFVLQFLAAKLGIVTCGDLAQHCRLSYKRPLSLSLWVMAEISVIASDIPEVMGTAFALQLLFGLPLWAGVVVTGLDTILFLMLQSFSIRALEALIGGFLALVSFCFVTEVFLSDIDLVKMAGGLIPLSGFFVDQNKADYVFLTISLVGAVVMPHNLYLHSALVQSRRIERDRKSINEAIRYNLIECAIALSISLIINASVVIVASNIFEGTEEGLLIESSGVDEDSSIFSKASLMLKSLGPMAPTVFAIALLASGQSSTITGTYAGQFVMEGFLELKVIAWQRNLITRMVAIVPSLLVALLATQAASDQLIIVSQVLLSIQLPFALIPLLKLTNSRRIMGDWKNSDAVSYIGWLLTILVISADFLMVVMNIYPYIGFEGVLPFLLMVFIAVLALFYIALLLWVIWAPVDDNSVNYSRMSERRVIEMELSALDSDSPPPPPSSSDLPL
jgi:natural resistance-associated macrophage protein 2